MTTYEYQHNKQKGHETIVKKLKVKQEVVEFCLTLTKAT